MTPLTVRAAMLMVVSAIVLSGCGGGSGGESAAAPTAPAVSPSPTRAGFAGVVDIGGGRKLYAECSGSGSPTIVLESGDESGISDWRSVLPRLVDRTRVCGYDRLGTGRSDAATGCRGLTELRSDLEALLERLGESGPYVLVGESGGGYLAAGFAYEHASDVAGIVLVDTFSAIIPALAPAELIADLKCDSKVNVERRDYVNVEHDAWSPRHRLGEFPMIIISNDYGDAFEDAGQRTNVEDQRGWLVLSPRARQVVVTSGHSAAENEPDLVLAQILSVLEDARAGRLPTG